MAADGQEMLTGKLYKDKVNASFYEKVSQLSLNRGTLQLYLIAVKDCMNE